MTPAERHAEAILREVSETSVAVAVDYLMEGKISEAEIILETRNHTHNTHTKPSELRRLRANQSSGRLRERVHYHAEDELLSQAGLRWGRLGKQDNAFRAIESMSDRAKASGYYDRARDWLVDASYLPSVRYTAIDESH